MDAAAIQAFPAAREISSSSRLKVIIARQLRQQHAQESTRLCRSLGAFVVPDGPRLRREATMSL